MRRLVLLMAALAVVAPAPIPLAAQERPVPGDIVPDEIPVALLIDLSSGQTLFSRGAGRRFMPASVTKVMTAYTAFKLIGEGKLSPDRRVQITQKLEDEWSGEGSSMFLKAGQQPTVGQLILGSTTVSGNDATVALGEAATGSLANWSRLMNANASELGMTGSYFHSPNGFPDGGRTFTTAHDLALLGEAVTLRYPALYHRYFGHHGMTWGKITQANHDPITGRVEGADGLKTGFTNEAGYTFLGSAERNGRRLILVLAGAPTAGMRNQAARDLMEWGFASFASRPLAPQGLLVGKAMVQDGMSDTVMLRTSRQVAVSFPEGRESEYTLSIRYRGPVEAPVAEGEEIAWLRVNIAGSHPVEFPLEAAEPVPKANVWYRLVNGLYGLFG